MNILLKFVWIWFVASSGASSRLFTKNSSQHFMTLSPLLQLQYFIITLSHFLINFSCHLWLSGSDNITACQQFCVDIDQIEFTLHQSVSHKSHKSVHRVRFDTRGQSNFLQNTKFYPVIHKDFEIGKGVEVFNTIHKNSEFSPFLLKTDMVRWDNQGN